MAKKEVEENKSAAKKSAKTKAAKSEKKSGGPAVDSKASKDATPWHFALIQKPVVTEKASLVSGDRNRVVFKVDRDATKTDIKEAIEKVFGVKVAKVRTVNLLGKVKRTTRGTGRRASFKKAYITLKEGETINLVEGV